MSLICLLCFHMMPTDGAVHSWLFILETGMGVRHQGIPVAVGHAARTLRPPCCVQPAPHWSPGAGDPLTEGKASAGAGAAHGEAQLANRLLHGLQHHKPFRYKDAQSKRCFVITWMGKGRRKKGGSFKVKKKKICSLSLN